MLRIPVRAPRANAYAERWVGTVRRELLDRMLLFGGPQLRLVVVEYVDHYNTHRRTGHWSRRRRWDRANRWPSCRLGGWCAGIDSVG